MARTGLLHRPIDRLQGLPAALGQDRSEPEFARHPRRHFGAGPPATGGRRGAGPPRPRAPPASPAATGGRVHGPPSAGGVASRSGNRARSSGRSTLGALPFRRRKSPRASGPCALYRASNCPIQRGTKLVTAATSAIV